MINEQQKTNEALLLRIDSAVEASKSGTRFCRRDRCSIATNNNFRNADGRENVNCLQLIIVLVDPMVMK